MWGCGVPSIWDFWGGASRASKLRRLASSSITRVKAAAQKNSSRATGSLSGQKRALQARQRLTMGDYKAQRKASAIDGQNIKWNWGDDWPDALDVISRGVQGRPLSKIFSILDLLDELNHGSYCRQPGRETSGSAGATQGEKEMEVDRRKEAQKACQRLIVPRQPKEDTDVFLRQLDAHRNAPEQLFAPQMPGEEPVWRQAADRGKEERDGRRPHVPQVVARDEQGVRGAVAVAESGRASVLPKGAAENARPSAPAARAAKCGVPITRSYDRGRPLQAAPRRGEDVHRRRPPVRRGARELRPVRNRSTRRRTRRASRSSPATRGSTSARSRWCARRRWSRR